MTGVPGRPPVGEVRLVDEVAGEFADLVAGERPTALALSGGDTARRCYEALAGAPGGLDWGSVTVLFGDERWVPVDHPDSNEGMARRALLDSVGATKVRSIWGAGATPEEAAEAYGALVGALASPGLVHLGLGEDGHTASLFPGSGALEETGRLVVATGDEHHPHRRVTFTLAALARAELAVVTVSGEGKAPAWARLCAGEDGPAARIRARRVLWLVDAGSAQPLSGPGGPTSGRRPRPGPARRGEAGWP